MRLANTLAFTAFVVMMPALVLADGGMVVHESTLTTQSEAAQRGLVSSDGQRAVYWRTGEQSWDLFIDPGRTSEAQVAWVVPLPVAPVDIALTDSTFIDELDAATAPVLNTQTIERRTVTTYDYSGGSGGNFFDCGCGSAEYADGGKESSDVSETPAGQTDEGVEPPVKVWGTGLLGELEWTLLSASSGDNLETWLQGNDYAVPESLSASAQSYVEKEWVFFAAKFVRDMSASEELPAIRFSMENLEKPIYPMEFTRISVTTSLRFTLFVVDAFAADLFYAPESLGYGMMGSFYARDLTIDEGWDYSEVGQSAPDFEDLYRARVDELVASGMLVLQYHNPVTEGTIADRINALAGIENFPLDAQSDDYHPRLREILAGGYPVMRYYGDVPIAQMLDIPLVERVSGASNQEGGYYSRTVTINSHDYATNYGSGRTLVFGLLFVFLLPSWLFARRRR